MNNEYKKIQKLIEQAEKNSVYDEHCLYRLGFHIMPPTGWLNDPNGLCQYGNTYHLFFQYSPLDARGGMKVWGHYITEDFETFKYEGAPFVPDETFDRDGVFSGCAFVDEDGMHIFYTGNVQLEGNYDYTTSGRRADTILVESVDGKHFGKKQVVIDTDEYPQYYSCHIRDPKVWKENDTYYMVLGGRTMEDEGRILMYVSGDLKKWSFHKELVTDTLFAYMWECPDLFALNGYHVLSFSPQGLEKEEFRFQNIYQAGYFVVKGNPVTEDITFPAETFMEWDMGFDFYAPQTFLDGKGRRILIGWAGVPYAEYSNAEVETENWQHCFTVPRELSVRTNLHTGITKVYQQPIQEITSLRTGNSICCKDGETFFDEEYLDIEFSHLPEQFDITIAGGVTISYNEDKVVLKLTKEVGRGREVRKCIISEIHSMRILVDSSILEYYMNDGEFVFTTRYYKADKGTMITFHCAGAEITAHKMKKITVI